MTDEPEYPDAPICFRVHGGSTEVIPRNQDARLLRFLGKNRGRALHWDDLYQALGKSPEVNRCLSTLRNKWHVPIECELVTKERRRGQFGLYSLGEGVEVWEPLPFDARD